MKKAHIITTLLAIILQNCDGQENRKAKKSDVITTSQIGIDKNTNDTSINFLDKKYQINGFFIPDNPSPYPTYSFSDKKIGVISVDFIGKRNEIQYYWSFNNRDGYFSKKNDLESAAQNSRVIKSLINEDDYYIVASYIPSKFINYIEAEDREFEPKQNAQTFFYLKENNSWKLIGEKKTLDIPENILAFETNLIQKKIFRNLKDDLKIYEGQHTASVETEATTTGMASIFYDFIINREDILLSLNTYKEPTICEGNYIGIVNGKQLEVYYLGDQLPCVSINPKFIIKKENSKFYIKGIGGEATNHKWILMK